MAVWDVGLSDRVHRIEFCHGTTTGKRIVYVNGKVRSCLGLDLSPCPEDKFGSWDSQDFIRDGESMKALAEDGLLS